MPAEWIRRFYQGPYIATEVTCRGNVRVMRQPDLPLALIDESQEHVLLVLDHRKSVLCTYEGTACASPAFGPYGYRSSDRHGPSILGFNGERLDPFTGHYILGNGYRTYSSVLMRFQSADHLSPFGKGGINGYMYCGGEPINRQDPSGKAFIPVLKRLSGIAKPVAKIGVGGGMIATLKEHAEFATDVWQTAKHALTRGPVPAHEFPVERAHLLKHANKANRPFNNSVNGVNHNLATWGDASLTSRQAEYYVKGTWSDQSNTTLYMNSAAGWLLGFWKTRQAGALTGFAFNAAGAGGAGVLDHSSYKTGRILTERIAPQAGRIRQ